MSIMVENGSVQFQVPEVLDIRSVTPLYLQMQKIGPDFDVQLDFQGVKHIDSAGMAFLNYLKEHYPRCRMENLPEKVHPSPVTGPERKVPKKRPSGIFHFARRLWRLGKIYVKIKARVMNYMVLLADEIGFTLQYLRKREGVYPGDVVRQLYKLGYKSFPVINLISFLVGVTISMTSAGQLKQFGADIYLADLIGYGMIRELVPLMAGIILAGKVGASITAEIASMKVLEEVDALTTMGINPERFLMVPRLLGITLAVPLLVAFADAVGIFGGILVGRFMLLISPTVFLKEMFTIVGMGDVLVGILKTMVFGWLVVICAGYKGFNVKRGPEGVGQATTESVVLSIVLIIFADCIFALVL